MSPEPPAAHGRAPSVAPSAGAGAAAARVLAWARIDLAPRHRQPGWGLVLVATVVSLAASLGADALVVRVATALFPATAHFSHFRFSDYGSLTAVGVVVACASWPVVTRVTSAPRRVFFRLAVAVTLVLWLPDGWLLVRGEQGAAVGALMVMHLLIALVTYNVMVHVARVHHLAAGDPARASGPVALGEQAVRRLWNAMGLLVALELALGVATIVSVPYRRPDAVLPSRATWLYAAHGALGVVLGVGALGLLVLSPLAGRMARIGALLGGAGVLVGLGGGVLATFQATRLLGMGVMMLGAVMAGVGYLLPALESLGTAEAAKAQAARAAMAEAQEARRGAAARTGRSPDAHPSPRGEPGDNAPVD